MLSICLNFN